MGKRISRTTSVGIGATVDNALTGTTFELAPDTSVVSFYALTSAGDVRATILIGSDLVVDDTQLQIGTALKVPDDLIAQHGAFRAERVTLRLRQVAGGAAVNVVWAVDYEAVG